jgi:hypothetical protein
MSGRHSSNRCAGRLLEAIEPQPGRIAEGDHRNSRTEAARAAGLSEHQQVQAVRNFIDLVRITAACDHHVLLHRRDIERQIEADDITELLQSDRVDRQAWAELLAARLARARIGPGWEGAA